MPDIIKVWSRHEAMLTRLGFVPMDEYVGVMVMEHPNKPKVRLVASARVEGRLDLFTQFGSSPLNTPGDPLNICIGVNDHDEVFAEHMTETVVSHFISLNVR